jgi:hypothetical protein
MSFSRVFLIGLVAALPVVGHAIIKAGEYNLISIGPEAKLIGQKAATKAAATKAIESTFSTPKRDFSSPAEKAASVIEPSPRSEFPGSSRPPVIHDALVAVVNSSSEKRDSEWAAILQLVKEQDNVTGGRKHLGKAITHYGSYPSTEADYKNIFGDTSSTEMLATLSEAQTFLKLPNHVLLASQDDFEHSLNSDAVVTFTGHNDAGILKLANGSGLSLNSMAESCAARQTLCIFLSCSSKTHVQLRSGIGVPLSITYDEAEDLVKLISSFHRYALEHDATYSEFVDALSVIIAVENVVAHARLGVRYMAAPVGMVGGGMTIISFSEKPPLVADETLRDLRATAPASSFLRR